VLHVLLAVRFLLKLRVKMQSQILILQLILMLGLLNVWLVRFNKATPYRGGAAKSMREEFATYGLPAWATNVVGILKVGSALCLGAGFWFPSLITPAAAIIAGLMIGAIAMHIKIKDPLRKSIPALMMLLCSLTLLAVTPLAA
jgi:membrane-associated phospholipid phosphatase